MQKRRKRKALPGVLRRVLALGMTAAALWMALLTAEVPSPGEIAGKLSEAALDWDLAAYGAGGEQNFWTGLLEWQMPLLTAASMSSAEEDSSDAGAASDAEEESAESSGSSAEESEESQPSQESQAEASPVEESAGSGGDAGTVTLKNATGLNVDVAALCAAPVNITLGGADSPQILILHTHATEAYTPDGDDTYVPSGDHRTTDTSQNVVRVGDEIAGVLESCGFSVIHDTTLYDYPDYTKAYANAYDGIEEWLQKYPSIRVVMDVHRDALEGDDGTIYKTMAEVDGEKVAQVMLVMGSNDSGKSFDSWQENLTLAFKLQMQLNAQYPSLARPVTLRSARYNEQLTNGSLLVEVGSHGNTLQEALAAARLFAASAAQVFQGLQ